jgi:hypothetical protein
MTETDKREMELLEKDITNRLFELEALAQAMELLFNDCDIDYMKSERFEPGLLFATQKRLYNDLHTQVRELIVKR